MYKNKDGSNKLCKKGKNCSSGRNYPLWKQPWEVKNKVRTCLQEKKIGAS